MTSKKSKKSSQKKGKSVDIDGETNEEIYTVEAIVDHKIEDGVKKYLLKWEGWPSSSNTWEVESQLIGCPALLAKYNESLSKQQKGRGKSKASQSSIEPFLVPDDASPKKKQKIRANEENEEKKAEENEESEVEMGFKIEGARLTADETIEFYVCDDGFRSYMPAKQVHKEHPQKVIEFYESRLIFESITAQKLDQEEEMKLSGKNDPK